MSAVANIKATTIANPGNGIQIYTNSATVASDKTFAPEGPVAPGVNRWVDRSGVAAVGYPSYTFSVRRPVAGQRNFRIVEKIVLPVMNVTSPSTGSGIQPLPSVGYSLICNREYIIPEAALATDKAIFYSLCASFMSDVINASDSSPLDNVAGPLRAAIETGEQPY